MSKPTSFQTNLPVTQVGSQVTVTPFNQANAAQIFQGGVKSTPIPAQARIVHPIAPLQK